MQDQVKENELVEVAMQIILYAGNARMKVDEALDAMKQFSFVEATTLLKEAEEWIRQAHITQTEVIQKETAGATYEPMLLFNHAQDTLMTIMSEVRMGKQMIEVLIIFYEKFKESEECI